MSTARRRWNPAAAGRIRLMPLAAFARPGHQGMPPRDGRATEGRPYAGQRYRHGWIPVSPLAVLSSDDVDDEYGPVLDSVEVDEGVRVVARERGITIESERGDDIAIHAAPSIEDAQRWADAIDDRETFSRSSFGTDPYEGGVAVRFGDHEAELDDAQAHDAAQALRDMAYQVEDLATPRDEPDLPEPEGDETPIPDGPVRERFDPSQLRDLIGRWTRVGGRRRKPTGVTWKKPIPPPAPKKSLLPTTPPRGRGARRDLAVRDELTRAKTPEAVGEAASAEAKRITGGRDIPFDFSGSDTQLAREHAEGVLRGLEAFPKARLSRVSMADGTHGGRPAFAWMETHNSGGYHGIPYREDYEIVFSRDWASPDSVERYREALAKAAKGTPRMGRGNVGGTPAAVGAHEFGHVVAHSSMSNRVAGDLAHEHSDLHIHHEASDDQYVLGARHRMHVGNQVSLYALENDNELAAEAFADVIQQGDEASELSRRIYDTFEDRIAEYGYE